jgi:hypothetical protein
MLDIGPIAGFRSTATVTPPPVAGFKLRRQHSRFEPIVPSIIRELVEIPNQYAIELQIGKVRNDPFGPMAFEVVITHGSHR